MSEKVSENANDSGVGSMELLGRYLEGHHARGARRYLVEIASVGGWWAEYATMSYEAAAIEAAKRLLEGGHTVRISKTYECIEYGMTVAP